MTVGQLLAFATFGVGFHRPRPFGGLFFGHFGDRIGRKPILVATILLVGGGTFLIGLLPTPRPDRHVGTNPALLLLRLVQGFGAGAEYGGAVILAVEYAPPGKRGLYGSFAPMGVTVGNLLAIGVFAVVGLLPHDAMIAWGWRIPFLLSLILLGVGVWIRRKVEETPVFAIAGQTQAKLRAPAISALVRHPRNFLVVIGARLAENGLGYLFPQCSACSIHHQHAAPAARGRPDRHHARHLRRDRRRDLLRLAIGDKVGRRCSGLYRWRTVLRFAFAFPFFLLTGNLRADLDADRCCSPSS